MAETGSGLPSHAMIWASGNSRWRAQPGISEDGPFFARRIAGVWPANLRGAGRFFCDTVFEPVDLRLGEVDFISMRQRVLGGKWQ